LSSYFPLVSVVALAVFPSLSLKDTVPPLIGAPLARVPDRRTLPEIVVVEVVGGVEVSEVPLHPVRKLEAERLKNSDRKIKGLEKILYEVRVSEQFQCQ